MGSVAAAQPRMMIFDVSLTTQLFAPIIRPDLGLAPNKSVGPRVLGALEGFLGADTTFLAGSSPTLADLVVYGDVGQVVPPHSLTTLAHRKTINRLTGLHGVVPKQILRSGRL